MRLTLWLLVLKNYKNIIKLFINKINFIFQIDLEEDDTSNVKDSKDEVKTTSDISIIPIEKVCIYFFFLNYKILM